jgi:hypothetical protein
MVEGLTGPLLLLLLLLLSLPKQERRARRAGKKKNIFDVVLRKKKGRGEGEDELIGAYRAAAIGRCRSNPRSGAINEIPVKLRPSLYTSKKARNDTQTTIVH